MLGILQGRLTKPWNGELQCFPKGAWEKEFELAHACGFDELELFVEQQHNADNPCWTLDGRRRIRELGRQHGVAVPTLCADCFIDRPFVRVVPAARAESSALLTRVIERSAAAGIPVVLVPVLEGGAIVTAQDERDLLDALAAPLAAAGRLGIGVALESDWTGAALRALKQNRASAACVSLG